ncbi:glycosyltransferase family 4 protein [Dictyobacter formicarum]|uniref:Glycosyl transferase n=1 Tax=Dictyobacter formicarum TaxID=2778368 RepID=A0ABQ3VCA3_9CHLR|nr:glycosyltransferase family 4 protein [Dictyobacter formicarum]GHO83111.1 glycosyl transferase [Dictyobacter formicarum]
MKIAQLAPPWIEVPPKAYGGTETVLHILVEEQVAQGHEVTLIAASGSQTAANLVSLTSHSLLEEGFSWHDTQKEREYLQQALAYINDNDFDIIHTHLSSGGDMYLFPLLAHARIPHVTTLHSNLPFQPEEVPPELSQNDIIRWAEHVPIVAISEQARQHQGLPLHFIGVVHHGISLEQYCVPSDPPEDYFLWLGRFVPEKGPHLAIQAAQQAGVPLVLAGTISQNQEQYYKEIIEPQIDGQLIRNHGPAGYEEKLTLMGHARGFLNPITWEEPFGMVMIEALALGCPVISFARGAAPEIVKDGKTGFLVEDLKEMVQAIGRIDEIKREKARAYVQEHFSCTAMARKYNDIYQKAIHNFTPPPSFLVPNG